MLANCYHTNQKIITHYTCNVLNYTLGGYYKGEGKMPIHTTRWQTGGSRRCSRGRQAACHMPGAEPPQVVWRRGFSEPLPIRVSVKQREHGGLEQEKEAVPAPTGDKLVQGLRRDGHLRAQSQGGEHLRAPAPTEPVQGLRWGSVLRAPAQEEPVQCNAPTSKTHSSLGDTSSQPGSRLGGLPDVPMCKSEVETQKQVPGQANGKGVSESGGSERRCWNGECLCTARECWRRRDCRSGR